MYYQIVWFACFVEVVGAEMGHGEMCSITKGGSTLSTELTKRQNALANFLYRTGRAPSWAPVSVFDFASEAFSVEGRCLFLQSLSSIEHLCVQACTLA